MRILRAADRLATPWKNGLGVTREIAVHPPSAGLDDFDWRVSMASVDAGGLFSLFPGVDRILTVLEGELALRVDGGEPVQLDPTSSPFAFAGDVPVEAELIAGPVTDLNVMTRRGRVQAGVERLRIDAPIELEVMDATLLLARDYGAELTWPEHRCSLEPDDAVLFEGITTVRIAPRQPLMLFVVRLTLTAPATSPPPRR